MATIDRIRLENLRALAAELGGLRAFSEKVGRSESQVSQFLGKNPTRRIGNRLARSLETRLKLKEGALDVAPTQDGVREAPVRFGGPTEQALELARLFDKLPALAQAHLLGLARLLALVTNKSYQAFEAHLEDLNHARARGQPRRQREPSKT